MFSLAVPFWPLTQHRLPYVPAETSREARMGMSHDEIVSNIREKVSKDCDREFGNMDRFVEDLHIPSDDLSCTAQALEEIRHKVRPERI